MRAWRLCLKTRPYSQFDGVRFAAIDGNSIVEEHGAPSACPIRSHVGPTFVVVHRGGRYGRLTPTQ